MTVDTIVNCWQEEEGLFEVLKGVLYFIFSQDDRVCVSNQVIQIANVKYRTAGTAKGLFCIYTDNSK